MEATDVHEVELAREYVTMALYVSLSLLAVGLAAPDPSGPSAWTVFLTAVGLLLAHLVAFAMSSRLVNHGELDGASLRLLGVQASAGLTVAAVATLPILLLPEPAGVEVAGLLLVALIGVVGYRTARSAEVGRLRALVYVVLVGVACAVVLLVKSLVH